MNYYDLLGISPQATPTQIREAYRRLAKQYHPDRFHRLSETAKTYVQEKMLMLNEAYRVLNDPEERQKYDQETRASSVSSQAYARYVDLDWRLAQLLGQEKSRKRGLEHVNDKQTISLAWIRGLGFPLFIFDELARQIGFIFDLLMIFLLLIIGTSVKHFPWRSKTSLGFWISWGCLWGWTFFILPHFSSNSELWHGTLLLLFLLSQALFFRLYHLVEKDNNAQRLQEHTALQQEMLEVILELKQLEDEIFGSDKHPFPQSQYN